MDTKKLRQKILDLAIHGKLVPQDPNDEPASVLLERIKEEKERLIKEGKIKRSKKSAKTSDTPHYGNVPFEVPDNWVWTTLGSVCNFENGFAFSSDDYKQEGIPLIRISNISDNTIDLNGCVFVQKEIEDRFVVKNGDLLIALSGATTGKMGIYSSDKVAYLNQRVGNLRIIDTSILSPEYRNIFMCSKTETILKLAYGGAQPNISGTAICSFLFPLPPLAEQQRIVTEVDHWLTLIDLIENEKFDLHTIIKQAKSKILDLAIHGKLVPQDPNDEPAVELLKRINPDFIPCDNGHSEKLPQNWCWTKGKFIFSPMKSVRPTGEMFQYIDIDSIDNTRQAVKEIKVIKTSNAPSRASRYTQEGDVIFSMVRPYLRNIAKISINDCIASTGFYVCRPLDMLHSEYCYYLMISDYVVCGLNQFMKGDNSPSISKGDIDNWLFPLPPFSEQQRIVGKIEKLFSVLDSIQCALEA